MIPLSGGFPNPDMFPFKKASIETADGHSIVLDGAKLKKSLQYLPTAGLPDLVKWLKDLQDRVHKPKVGTDLVVTCGSQDGLCKAIEMLTDPGDSVIVEDYVYAGTLGIMVRRIQKCFEFAIIKFGLGTVPTCLYSRRKRQQRHETGQA